MLAAWYWSLPGHFFLYGRFDQPNLKSFDFKDGMFFQALMPRKDSMINSNTRQKDPACE